MNTVSIHVLSAQKFESWCPNSIMFLIGNVADDLCIASQGNDFSNIEASALSTKTTYYDTNQLRANPSKTQVCAFHLRNREAKRELNVVRNGIRLSNTATPVYLGIHLDRTLCYKTHIEKTKMKVNARNDIIRKLANSKWGCKATTLRDWMGMEVAESLPVGSGEDWLC